MWDNFANDTCLPDARYMCSPQGYPAYVVNASKPEHVQLGVAFARKRNIRLVVKGTGHDYVGRSIAPNALSIWTHNIKSIKYHSGSFKPKGCGNQLPGNAVTVAAGTQMWDAHSFLRPYNETIVGGGGKTVGVGGYITGGGHSILGPRYGMAADQVLEVELVTPAGEIVTANECQNKDLFWATRGGGGSTFGVLTSLTLLTVPSPKMLNSDLTLSVDATSPDLPAFYAFLLSKYPYLDAQNISAYFWLLKAFDNPFPFGPRKLSGIGGKAVLLDTTDESAIAAIFAPIAEEAKQKFPDANVTFFQQPTKFDSFYDWYEVNYDQGAAGGDQLLAGRLLDENALTRDLGALAEAVTPAVEAVGAYSVYLVAGKGVQNAKPRGGGNAINPAWRKALTHTLIGKNFPPQNDTEEADTIRSLISLTDPLRKLAPDMGSYMNEGLKYEPNFQKAFWGDNYDRLLKIKRTVDPGDVLWCHPCVGNERWHEVGDKLCRV